MEITTALCCSAFWTKNENAGKIPASETKSYELSDNDQK